MGNNVLDIRVFPHVLPLVLCPIYVMILCSAKYSGAGTNLKVQCIRPGRSAGIFLSCASTSFGSTRLQLQLVVLASAFVVSAVWSDCFLFAVLLLTLAKPFVRGGVGCTCLLALWNGHHWLSNSRYRERCVHEGLRSERTINLGGGFKKLREF